MEEGGDEKEGGVEAMRPEDTTKDLVARWMKDGGQACSKDAAKK
jgi:hypothetical protein